MARISISDAQDRIVYAHPLCATGLHTTCVLDGTVATTTTTKM